MLKFEKILVKVLRVIVKVCTFVQQNSEAMTLAKKIKIMQDLTDKDKQMMKAVGHQLFRTFMDSLEIKHCNSLFKRGYLLKGIEGGRVFFYCQSVFLNKI